MNKIYFILACITIVFTARSQDSISTKNIFKILTNDSVKYWDCFNDRYYMRYTMGYRFNSDSTWINYIIDHQNKRILPMDDYHYKLGEKFKFVIKSDTLILSFYTRVEKQWICYEKHLIKYISERKLALLKIDIINELGSKISDTTCTLFDDAQDQKTVPLPGMVLYPNDSDKWFIGDQSDGPAQMGVK